MNYYNKGEGRLATLAVIFILFVGGGAGAYTQYILGSMLSSWMVGLSVIAIGIFLLLVVAGMRGSGDRSGTVRWLLLMVVPIALIAYFLA